MRQTISKWEKGASVPDADLLIRIAEIFEVLVSKLLGTKSDADIDIGREANMIAEHLSRINEQLAIKNRRSRRIWKTVAAILIAVVIINILLIIFSMTAFHGFQNGGTINEVITEAVGSG